MLQRKISLCVATWRASAMQSRTEQKNGSSGNLARIPRETRAESTKARGADYIKGGNRSSIARCCRTSPVSNQRNGMARVEFPVTSKTQL